MGDPNEPFIVDFLPDEEVNLPGRIGMAGTPGASGRDLRADLTRLKKRYRADKLVTLLEGGQFVKDELAALGVPLLIAQTRRAGIAADWSPMPDGDVPVSVDSLFSLVERCLADARDGKIVVLHDAGGDGRVALAAAACLIALGASVDESMATVDMMRPGCVPNPSQRQTLRAFDEVWRKRALERAAPAAISDMFELGEAGGSSGPWRISQTGVAPLSRPGAAAVVYRGLDPEAERAGVPAASPLPRWSPFGLPPAGRSAPPLTAPAREEARWIRPGDTFHLSPGSVLYFGRSEDCDVTIASSQLSRVHAALAFAPVAEGQLVLADLDSRNGTWVQGEPAQVCFLGVGEEFSLARAYRFCFDGLG